MFCRDIAVLPILLKGEVVVCGGSCTFGGRFAGLQMEKENPIAEARRYVANAEEIIQRSKYDPETKSYKDKKYVRIAGDTLWKGCLIALDGVFNVRKGKGRPSIKKYQEAVAKRDGKLLKFLNLGYETMHLVMGYDGNRGKKVCDAGFEYANAIIDCCASLMPKVACA